MTFVPHGRSTPRPRSSEPPEALPAEPPAKPLQPPEPLSRAPKQARSRGRARGQRDFLYYFSSFPLSLSALTGVSQRAFLYYFAWRPLGERVVPLRSGSRLPWDAALSSFDPSSEPALPRRRSAYRALHTRLRRSAASPSPERHARSSLSSPSSLPRAEGEALSSGGLGRIWSVSLFYLPLQSKQSWCGSSAG